MEQFCSGEIPKIVLPNILSIARVFIVLPLFPCMKASRIFLSALILIVIVLTDVLDGYFARKFHTENPLGKVLDHGVDKVVSIFISYTFYKFSFLPGWAFLFFFLRDLLIVIVGGVIYFRFKVAFSSLWLGKIAGVFYFGMFFAFLLKFEKLGRFFMLLSIVLLSLVVIFYPLKFYPILRERVFNAKGGKV